MRLPRMTFDWCLSIGDYEMKFFLGQVDEVEEEPPVVDEKTAAHLGAPTGFGLRMRPDHIDSE